MTGPDTGISGPRLEVRGLTAGYRGMPAVHDLDLEVGAGEVVSLLGANGAGKSTTLLAVSGLLAHLGGTVRFDGRSVPRRASPVAAAALARAGLAHVPEDRALFFDLTVGEHLRLGRRRGGSAADLDAVLSLFPALGDLIDRKAGLLSGGEQQMLALGRALVSRPRLLLVDELSLGLAPVVVERLLPVLRTVADETGAGVLVVEQHVDLALSVSDRAYLLRRGRVTVAGSSAELADRLHEVEAGYLGDRT